MTLEKCVHVEKSCALYPELQKYTRVLRFNKILMKRVFYDIFATSLNQSCVPNKYQMTYLEVPNLKIVILCYAVLPCLIHKLTSDLLS